MTSEVSEILDGYKEALDESRDRYEEMYTERLENAEDFYNDFFHELVREYDFDDAASRRSIKTSVEETFGSEDVRFAAIDGTCFKEQLEDYMVFFAASYAVRGEIHFQGDPPSFEYDKWSTEQDVSMVAYIPVPFAELGELADESHQFVDSDDEKMDLSFIHTRLMQLAEVYLTYDLVNASSLRPRYILWDHSMSSIYNSNYAEYDKIDLVGYQHMGREVTEQDIILAQSHPYNDNLEIPTTKRYKAYDYVLAELQERGSTNIQEFVQETGIPEDELEGRLSNYLFEKISGNEPLVNYDNSTGELSFNRSYDGSWEYCVRLFEDFCRRLFKEKDSEALIYRKVGEDGEKLRWMSTKDVEFLISVGIRALVEKCWNNDVFLVGITKDSSSKYLSQNYLGIMRDHDAYDFEDTELPWTDRTFLEVLPLVDENIEAPWSTIEFDSVFMTLRPKPDGDSIDVQGVRGDIVAPPERLFARSLGQFYIDRSKESPTYGHAIFIDRLINPSMSDDRERGDEVTIENENVGRVTPIQFFNSETPNEGQKINMYMLEILTRNLYPEVIGYPDPLHKADWGAKSLNQKVQPMIKNSDISMKANPLKKKLRGPEREGGR